MILRDYDAGVKLMLYEKAFPPKKLILTYAFNVASFVDYPVLL